MTLDALGPGNTAMQEHAYISSTREQRYETKDEIRRNGKSCFRIEWPFEPPWVSSDASNLLQIAAEEATLRPIDKLND